MEVEYISCFPGDCDNQISVPGRSDRAKHREIVMDPSTVRIVAGVLIVIVLAILIIRMRKAKKQ